MACTLTIVSNSAGSVTSSNATFTLVTPPVITGRTQPSRQWVKDLDGTLTDSAQGIVASFRHALGEVGAVVPDGDLAGRIVGPPMHHTLSEMGLGRDADAGEGGTADSPVSSDMPNMSSAARRLASPAAGAAGGGFGPAGARAARFFSLTAEFASAPDFRTANTVLHALQRTRTPRSDTFSSATRNREWQLGHWTTTTHCRRRYRP